MSLNQTGVVKVSAVVPNEILIAPETAVTISLKLCPFFSTPPESLKAGTPISTTLEAGGIANRQGFYSNSASYSTVLLHDTKLNEGYANATVLIKGVVNLNALDPEVQAKWTEEMKAKLKHIIFVK